mmetsp:Transcript_15796/g.34330  ORF Transcript_15796/g.34330 Transcript_15796/m.34330 type:complete len:388 (+) Transcript_15796:64-1227(+)
MSSSSSSAPLIRGYLPLRIGLPPSVGKTRTSSARQDTFLFAKEHRASGGGRANKTLFVTNCPFVPNVRTSLLLKSIFGRYGDVERVAVVRNPRDIGIASALAVASRESDEDGGGTSKEAPDAASKLFDDQMEIFGDPQHINFIDRHNEGKFAHVVFASAKDMKRAVKAIGKLMGSDYDDDELPPACMLGALEIQDLVEASAKLSEKEKASEFPAASIINADNDSDSDDGGDPKQKKKKTVKTSGIQALVDRQRSLYVKRRHLLEACNAIMEQYEDAEQEAEARARAASSQPDDEGFVTVVSAKAPAVGADLEDDEIGAAAPIGEGRRRGSKRKRKKKEARGSSELKDFYRFQTKETRKKGLKELRERFEADLAKVKKLKEEKAYRPF